MLHGLHIGKSQGAACLGLTGIQAHQAAADDLRHVSTGVDAQFNYEKDLETWKNRFQMEFGFLYSSDRPWPLFQTSQDRIYLESKWAYKTGKDSKFNYSASYNFRSQFSDGYSDYKQLEDGSWTWKLKSGWASPAYTDIALGIDWTPNKWLSVNLAPLTGGFTIVRIEELRQQYGMSLLEDGLDPAVGSNYHYARFQFGTQLKADAKFVINES